MNHFLLLGLAFVPFSFLAQGVQVAIIVHPENKLEQYTRQDIKALWLYKKPIVEDDIATCFSKDETDPVTQVFNNVVLKSNATVIREYFSRIQVEKNIPPPVEFESDSVLIAEVTKNTNAIGYVNLKAINNNNFKRIRIVGLLANDKIISFLDNEDWNLDSLIQSFNSLINNNQVLKDSSKDLKETKANTSLISKIRIINAQDNVPIALKYLVIKNQSGQIVYNNFSGENGEIEANFRPDQRYKVEFPLLSSKCILETSEGENQDYLIRFGPAINANNSIPKTEPKLSKPKPSHLSTRQEPTRIKSKSKQSISIPKRVHRIGKDTYDPFKIIEPIEEL